jgi:hypothetical protein
MRGLVDAAAGDIALVGFPDTLDEGRGAVGDRKRCHW